MYYAVLIDFGQSKALRIAADELIAYSGTFAFEGNYVVLSVNMTVDAAVDFVLLK
jgi:hypothetical protein